MFGDFRAPGKLTFWGKHLSVVNTSIHGFTNSYMCKIKCCLIKVDKRLKEMNRKQGEIDKQEILFYFNRLEATVRQFKFT